MSKKRKMKYHNSNSIPNEKVTEMLFMSYALVYLRELFPNMPISIFAPTLSEEFLMGYDAHIIGKSHCFELFIQFKIPDLKNDIFAIKKTLHQHNILRRYPKRTAFYVAPTFKSYLGLNSKQFSHLSAKDFLDNYVAVSVSSLTENMQRIGYKSDSSGLPNSAEELVSRKRRGMGKSLLNGKDWITGSDLFANFIASKVTVSDGRVLPVKNYSSANSGVSSVRNFSSTNGSLCYFAESSARFGDEKPLRVYTPDKMIDRSHNQLMENSHSPQDDSKKLSYWLNETSDLNIDYGKGGMMFRIYEPFDLDENRY